MLLTPWRKYPFSFMSPLNDLNGRRSAELDDDHAAHVLHNPMISHGWEADERMSQASWSRSAPKLQGSPSKERMYLGPRLGSCKTSLSTLLIEDEATPGVIE